MKKKLIIVSFLLFATMILMLHTNSIAGDDDDEDYEIGFKEGDEFVWTCKIFNEEKMNDAWGSNWDNYELFEEIESGKKMKMEITKITNKSYIMYSPETTLNESAYKVEYEIWRWSNNEKFSDVDSEDEEFSWFINPGYYGEDLYLDAIMIFWIPIQIEEYLDNLELYKWWYSDEDTLLYERYGSERLNWYNPSIHRGDLLIETTYNEKGIMSSYKILNDDEEVILELALETDTAFIIPLIIIVIAIASALAIVYIVMRKKGIKIIKKKRNVKKIE